jgi:hypothetical protein
VLLDVQLPDVDGFRIALELAAHEPPPAVVLDARSSCASEQRQPAHQPAEDQVEQAMRYPAIMLRSRSPLDTGPGRLWEPHEIVAQDEDLDLLGSV